jgi:integrase
MFYVWPGCPHETAKKAKGEHFAVKVRKDYRAHLEKHILPDPICKKQIALINRADSIAFRDRLIARFGYTRKSCLIFQAYKNIIHTALEKGIIDTDPVIRLSVAVKKGTRAATDLENIKKLLSPEYWTHPRLRLAVMTAGLVGLRAGEVRGILWKDLDPDNRRIHVDREIIDIEGEKKPKWEKTRTTIYPLALKKLLEPLRGAPNDRVFAISKRGPLSYKTLHDEMAAAIEKSGIPHITLHGLRHSIQTALRGAGVNPELLKATFGWTDDDVQETYTHRELYDLSQQLEITDDLFDDSENEKENNNGKARGNSKSFRRRTDRHIR